VPGVHSVCFNSVKVNDDGMICLFVCLLLNGTSALFRLLVPILLENDDGIKGSAPLAT